MKSNGKLILRAMSDIRQSQETSWQKSKLGLAWLCGVGVWLADDLQTKSSSASHSDDRIHRYDCVSCHRQCLLWSVSTSNRMLAAVHFMATGVSNNNKGFLKVKHTSETSSNHRGRHVIQNYNLKNHKCWSSLRVSSLFSLECLKLNRNIFFMWNMFFFLVWWKEAKYNEWNDLSVSAENRLFIKPPLLFWDPRSVRDSHRMNWWRN